MFADGSLTALMKSNIVTVYPNCHMMKKIAYTLIALAASVSLYAKEAPAALTRKLDAMIEDQLGKKAFPGASFIVGDRDGIIYSRNYGKLDYEGGSPVSDSTLYDVASLTKVISTTFAVMYLYDRGLIKLDEQLGNAIPSLRGMPIAALKISELLTHTSGIGNKVIYPYFVCCADEGKPIIRNKKSDDYPYYIDQNCYMARDVRISDFRSPGIDTLLVSVANGAYNASRRGQYTYNDLNFYLLKLVVEQKSGKKLDVLTRELLASINSNTAGYKPLEWYNVRYIAPTEYDYMLRRGDLRGEVHDEIALIAGGVGGNAGLFSTAGDIANFCEMIACNGNYRGKQIIKAETVALFTSSPLSAKGIYRGYGFDKRPGTSQPLGGDYMCGHTGFTGTMFWIDRKKGTYMVFLSNYIHPTRTNRQLVTSQLRANLWKEITGSL